MSFRRFRRHRAQAVSLSSLPFNDSADSHADLFFRAGEPSNALTLGLPRSGVHRFMESDRRSVLPVWSGYGADEPHVSIRRRLKLPVRAVRPSVLGPSRLLQAIRRAESWRAFNVLQVRVPARVRFCQQRSTRRQVLFAAGVGGRRGSAPGPYRRSENSNWRC